jgi:hypothetical protein
MENCTTKAKSVLDAIKGLQPLASAALASARLGIAPGFGLVGCKGGDRHEGIRKPLPGVVFRSG